MTDPVWNNTSGASKPPIYSLETRVKTPNGTGIPHILYLLSLFSHTVRECSGVFSVWMKVINQISHITTNAHFPMDPDLHLLYNDSKLSIPGKKITENPANRL